MYFKFFFPFCSYLLFAPMMMMAPAQIIYGADSGTNSENKAVQPLGKTTMKISNSSGSKKIQGKSNHCHYSPSFITPAIFYPGMPGVKK